MHHDIPLWRRILRENFTSLEKLAQFLELSPNQCAHLAERKCFPLNLPRRLAEKINKKTLDDPLFRQFVPLKEENAKIPFFVKDPVGDCRASLSTKALKKYDARILLLASSACAMHCRFCFRQNFEYAPLNTGFNEEMNIIKKDKSLKEVILSGGDPLALNNHQLKYLLDTLSSFSHITRIRFHTRFPIGIPERIEDEFLSILSNCTTQIWFVIHCNHPSELDADVIASLKKIQSLAIPVLNQTVLLKGVNDTPETLQYLCEKLVDHGIFPYYLHQLDRVEGSAQFEVSKDKGKELIQQLTECMPGYGVPKYVQEIPLALAKIPIAG
jgi:EF-P beta-lysylation protein EpmB